MRYIVVNKTKNGSEMHVLPNGRLSFYGRPKKFLSRETARDVAQEWADAMPASRMSVRKTD